MRLGGWLWRGAYLFVLGVFMVVFVGAGGLEGEVLYASFKALFALLLLTLAMNLALIGCEKVLKLSERRGEENERRSHEGGGGEEAD